ncbi:MAG: sulfotransferase [Nitrospira sp.]|nr:sulfotransferase [Nitrospira sp.]MCP9463389.1 sulfotransferase [Nitrospira sp.]
MSKDNLVVCVGAAKAGTSTLYRLMEQHPEVCVTKYKETNFFFDDSKFSKGPSWYVEQCFPSSFGKKVLFEADPIYMLYAECIARIYRYFPTARIVVMLRNPVDLAFSLYTYRSYYGRHGESFVEMCQCEEERIASGIPNALAEYGLLTRGRYAEQIENIYRYFQREQVYFILFEEFIRRQGDEFLKLQSWLDLTPCRIEGVWDNETGRPRLKVLARAMYHPRYRFLRKVLHPLIPSVVLRSRLAQMLHQINLVRYANHEKPKLDPATRAHLLLRYREDIERTEDLTGLDLSVWK